MKPNVYREMILTLEGRKVRETQVCSETWARIVQAGCDWSDEQCATWLKEATRPRNYHEARSNLLALGLAACDKRAEEIYAKLGGSAA